MARRHRLHARIAIVRGPKDVGLFDGQDVIHKIEGHFDRRANRFAAIDGYIAVKDLVYDFSIRHKPLLQGNQALQQQLSLGLVRMWGTHKIHR
jgi:hypothetical protein